MVGENVHARFRLSPWSCFLEITVGKTGFARYSCLSVRLSGNSGGTAESIFRPESFDSGRFYLERRYLYES